MSSKTRNYVIVAVIGLSLVGFFVFVTYYSGQTLETLDQERSGVRKSLEDSEAKVAAFKISLLLDDWYLKNNHSYAGFIENIANLRDVENVRSESKENYDVNIVYTLHSAKVNYVLKTKALDSDHFYCMSADIPLAYETLVEGDNFENSSDCARIPAL